MSNITEDKVTKIVRNTTASRMASLGASNASESFHPKWPNSGQVIFVGKRDELSHFTLSRSFSRVGNQTASPYAMHIVHCIGRSSLVAHSALHSINKLKIMLMGGCGKEDLFKTKVS